MGLGNHRVLVGDGVGFIVPHFEFWFDLVVFYLSLHLLISFCKDLHNVVTSPIMSNIEIIFSTDDQDTN